MMRDEKTGTLELSMEQVLKMTEQAVQKAYEVSEKQRDEKWQEHVAAFEKQIGELSSIVSENKLAAGRKPDEREDPKAGFKNFADFAQSVYRAEVIGHKGGGEIDKRLVDYETLRRAKAAGDGLREDEGVSGGYLIPTEFSNQVLEIGLEQSNFAARCTQMPMSVGSIEIPAIGGYDHSSGYVQGAIMLYWAGQEELLTESKPKFELIRLNLHDLTGLVFATNSMLEDSPISLEPILTKAFGDAFAWTMDEIIINGTGAGQPLGVINASCAVSVSGETSQTTDTIVWANVVKMLARLPSQSYKNAVWLHGPDSLPDMLRLNQAVGTGGSTVIIASGQGVQTPPVPLLGLPRIVTEHAQKLGDAGDLMLVDFSQYVLGQKRGRGLVADSSIHLKFDYRQTAFRFSFRMDGQPWWRTYMTPRYATTHYMSPVVLLAAI